jgi:hypothetical protein
VFWKEIPKLLDTKEGSDRKFSSSGPMMLGQLSIQMEYHVVRTVARELNLTALESAQSLFEKRNRSVDSGKKKKKKKTAYLYKSIIK